MGALVEELINVCPNSVLPTLKTQIALSGLHGKRKLHDRDGLGTEAWSSCTGAVIRSIVAQFRNLAKDPDARQRSIRYWRRCVVQASRQCDGVAADWYLWCCGGGVGGGGGEL
jgi:hypothetical protein